MSHTQSGNVLLAVNGTLMRGLKLNQNLTNVNATFVREDTTDVNYRLWSINDDHPGMIRTDKNGNHVDLEIWSVPPAGLANVLMNEPAGLCIGKLKLKNGEMVLGVLAEPFLVEGQKEITAFGGWRQYIQSLS